MRNNFLCFLRCLKQRFLGKIDATFQAVSAWDFPSEATAGFWGTFVGDFSRRFSRRFFCRLPHNFSGSKKQDFSRSFGAKKCLDFSVIFEGKIALIFRAKIVPEIRAANHSENGTESKLPRHRFYRNASHRNCNEWEFIIVCRPLKISCENACFIGKIFCEIADWKALKIVDFAHSILLEKMRRKIFRKRPKNRVKKFWFFRRFFNWLSTAKCRLILCRFF